MTIPNSIQQFQPQTAAFSAPQGAKQPAAAQDIVASNPVKNLPEEKEQPKSKKSVDSFIDSFSEKVVNSDDVRENVTMPRAIFKGYLSFFLATTATTLAGLTSNAKHFPAKAFHKLNTVAGAVLAAVGTFEFVKPFLVKQAGDKEEAKAPEVAEKEQPQVKD